MSFGSIQVTGFSKFVSLFIRNDLITGLSGQFAHRYKKQCNGLLLSRISMVYIFPKEASKSK